MEQNNKGSFNEKILVTRSSMPPYEEFIEMIKPLWESHWITNMGKYHMELEERLKDYLEVPGLSLMVNGHMALELALQAMNLPEGSEVITTPFTFISTTHAIVRNHLKPVFCDVKLTDGTIDESKIEDLITEKTSAILPVHVYGNICNVEAIQEIADRYSLKVIYDAAHAFGEKYKNKGIGCFGDASIFSFHATKVFNTIEGGAVSFRDMEMYNRLYNLKNFGIRGEELVVGIGANAKMNEFSAVMGLLNLKRHGKVLAERERVYRGYMNGLTDVDGIEFFKTDDDVIRNYSYFPIIVSDRYEGGRNDLYDKLQKEGIFTRKYFYPLTSDQACFKNKYKDVPIGVARELSRKILVLPMYEELSDESVERICRIIRQ